MRASTRNHFKINSCVAIKALTGTVAALLLNSVSWAAVSWMGSADAMWNSGPGTNWLGGAIPGSGDIVAFDANSTANLATVLGASFFVAGIQVTSPSSTVSIGGSNALTLGSSGVDLAAATQDLTINAPILLGADQTWTVAANRILAVSGGFSGVSASNIISFIGAGRLELGGALASGRLQIGNGSAAGEVVLSGAGTTWSQTSAATNLGLAIGNGANGAGTATFNGGSYTFGGDGYSNAARVGVATGTGQTATGTMNILSGTVRIGGPTATDASFNLGTSVSAGTSVGILNISGGALEIGRRLLMAANSTTNVATLTLSGTGVLEMKRTGSNAEGDLGMIRVGTGTTTLNLDGGTLIASAIHIGVGAAARTFINFNGTTVRANAATGAFITSPANAAQVVKSGGFIFDTNGFDVTFNGALTNAVGVSGTIAKKGTGVLTLSGANSTTGQVTVESGTLAFAGTGTLGAGAAVSVNPGTVLRFNRNDTFGNHATAVSQSIVVNGGTLANGGNFFNTLGAVTLNQGTIQSTGGVNANFPSFSLRGPISVTGTGASQITGTGTNSQMVVGTHVLGSQTVFDVSDVVAGTPDLLVSVPLQNNRDGALAEISTGLIKSGPGTMRLSGANSYTGTTSIQAGTLEVTGAISGSIDIASGAALDLSGIVGGFGLGMTQALSGSGMVIGNVAIDGAISAGPGIGSLIFTNDLNLAGAVNFDVTKTGLVLDSDLLTVGGTLALGGTLNLSFAGDPLVAGDAFDLFDAGLFAGTFSILNLPVLDPGLEWHTENLAVDGTLSVVPEPGVPMAIIAGCGVLVARRRRRGNVEVC